MQFWRITFITDITLQQIKLVRRDIQDIFSGIMDFQIIFMDAVDFYGLDAGVAADAVDFMNDIIAGFEIGKYVDFLPFLHVMAQAVLLHAVNIPFRYDD